MRTRKKLREQRECFQSVFCFGLFLRECREVKFLSSFIHIYSSGQLNGKYSERMKWLADLRNGTISAGVLIGIDFFERELEENVLALGKLKVSGKHDAGLEKKVEEQRKFAGELAELKKKHGIKSKIDEKKEGNGKEAEDKIDETALTEIKKQFGVDAENNAENGETEAEKQEANSQAGGTQATEKEEKKTENPELKTQNQKNGALAPEEKEAEKRAAEEKKQAVEEEKKEQTPRQIIKVVGIEEEKKEKDEPPPPGFAYKLVQGRRRELVLLEDEKEFEANEKKVHEANRELQKARIRGERSKAKEFERAISDGIDERERIVKKAREAKK